MNFGPVILFASALHNGYGIIHCVYYVKTIEMKHNMTSSYVILLALASVSHDVNAIISCPILC